MTNDQPAPRELTTEETYRCLQIVDSRKYPESRAVDSARQAMREGIAIGREEGAKVERALWELAAIGQEIEHAESAAPAPGWQWMPKEPTEAMIAATDEALGQVNGIILLAAATGRGHIDAHKDGSPLVRAYRAMLAAAPAPETPQEHDPIGQLMGKQCPCPRCAPETPRTTDEAVAWQERFGKLKDLSANQRLNALDGLYMRGLANGLILAEVIMLDGGHTAPNYVDAPRTMENDAQRESRIARLMHAVEGECDGLAINADQAWKILDYVDRAPAAPVAQADLRTISPATKFALAQAVGHDKDRMGGQTDPSPEETAEGYATTSAVIKAVYLLSRNNVPSTMAAQPTAPLPSQPEHWLELLAATGLVTEEELKVAASTAAPVAQADAQLDTKAAAALTHAARDVARASYPGGSLNRDQWEASRDDWEAELRDLARQLSDRAAIAAQADGGAK